MFNLQSGQNIAFSNATALGNYLKNKMHELWFLCMTRGLIIFTTYISVDLAHREIFRAKVGKGGINVKLSLKYLKRLPSYRADTV